MTLYEILLATAGVGLVLFAFVGLFGFSPSRLWHRLRGDVRGTHLTAGSSSRRDVAGDTSSFGDGGSGGADH